MDVWSWKLGDGYDEMRHDLRWLEMTRGESSLVLDRHLITRTRFDQEAKFMLRYRVHQLWLP